MISETCRVLPVATPKEKMINVRLTPSVHEAFKIACDLRGGSMSSILHQFIVRTIREEKEREPSAFATRPVGIPMKQITVSTPDKLRKAR